MIDETAGWLQGKRFRSKPFVILAEKFAASHFCRGKAQKITPGAVPKTIWGRRAAPKGEHPEIGSGKGVKRGARKRGRQGFTVTVNVYDPQVHVYTDCKTMSSGSYLTGRLRLSLSSHGPLRKRNKDTSQKPEKRINIPIVLSTEISPELAAPVIRHILFPLVNGADRPMNVVSDFMIENLGQRSMTKDRQSFKPLRVRVHNIVDVKRDTGRRGSCRR